MFYHDRAYLGETSNREYERVVVREGNIRFPSASLRAGSHFVRNDKDLV